MKLRYLTLTMFCISIFMHLTWGYLIPFCETTYIYWYFAKNRSWNANVKILVLGDSQIVSGLLPETIADIEGVKVEEVLFLPKPSQQPEGILSDTLSLVDKLPYLRKIYVNISPLNTSKNSITDAHKQLYYSLIRPELFHFTEPLLRKAYYNQLADVSWKLVIQIFPYFGLSSNTNRILYDPITKEDLKRRKAESIFIQKSMESQSGAWIWKSLEDIPTIKESENFSNLDTTILANKRNLSIQLWIQCLSEWEKRKLDVVVLRIPFSPQMEQDLRDKNANLVTESMIGLISKSPFQNNVTVFDFKSVFIKEYGYFADLTHLNQRGRDAFRNVLKKNLLNYTNSSAKGM